MKNLIVFLILAMAVTVNSATLKWDAVSDTDDCTIEKYKVVAVAQNPEGGETRVKFVTDTQLPDLFLSLRLVPNQAYDLSVLATSTKGFDGPLSVSIPYTFIPESLEESLPSMIIYLPQAPTNPTTEE